ncbi:MAG: ABC transporter permease [Micromonosporaceae bacterium]|nr:ABC transporter permease [Micromonosporaceae bacterium]
MNLTVARITARALLGRRRFLLLVPLPILVIGLTILAKAVAPDSADQWGLAIINGLGIHVLLPIVALIVGTAVLGAEIDDGTIVHILAKPLHRREIILAKLAVAVAVTVVVSAVPMFIAGAVAVSPRYGLGLVVGCVIGSLAYCSFFVLLSLLTRRPVLLGLLYVLLWESLLTNLLSSTRVLSVAHYSIAVAESVGGSPHLLTTRVSVPLALVMTGVFTLVGTLLAIDRLRSFTLTGETS